MSWGKGIKAHATAAVTPLKVKSVGPYARVRDTRPKSDRWMR